MYILEQCPVCSNEGMTKKIIEKVFTYKENTLKIPNYIIFECPRCGETFPDKDQSKALEPQLRELIQKRNNRS